MIPKKTKNRINHENQPNDPALKKVRADVKQDAKLAFVGAASIRLDAVIIVIVEVIAAMYLTKVLMLVQVMRHMIMKQQILLRTKKMLLTMK